MAKRISWKGRYMVGNINSKTPLSDVDGASGPSRCSHSFPRMYDAISLDKSEFEFPLYDIPEDRFVTYEPRDLDWLVFFGLAKRKPLPTLSRETINSLEYDILFGVFRRK